MLLEILFISIGLAMDAFAVAVCKGLSLKELNFKKALIVGIYFGFFQALMPLIGFLISHSFEEIVVSIDHWISLMLLSLIGLNMIKESFSKEEKKINDLMNFKTMVVLALATSIDALIVGITFSFLDMDIITGISIIGIITFIISYIGVYIGHLFGKKYQNKAVFLGGVILIIMGIEILLDHLGNM